MSIFDSEVGRNQLGREVLNGLFLRSLKIEWSKKVLTLKPHTPVDHQARGGQTPNRNNIPIFSGRTTLWLIPSHLILRPDSSPQASVINYA